MDVPPVRPVTDLAAAAYKPGPAEPSNQAPEIIRAVQLINRAGLLGESELRFQLDRGTRRPVILIVDRKTREVLRQIPPEYVLRVAEDLASLA